MIPSEWRWWVAQKAAGAEQHHSHRQDSKLLFPTMVRQPADMVAGWNRNQRGMWMSLAVPTWAVCQYKTLKSSNELGLLRDANELKAGESGGNSKRVYFLKSIGRCFLKIINGCILSKASKTVLEVIVPQQKLKGNWPPLTHRLWSKLQSAITHMALEIMHVWLYQQALYHCCMSNIS